MVITIDGAAGVGKTTTAKKLASKLGFRYLDTGAMYRAITYFFIKNEIDIESKDMVISSLDTLKLDVSFPIDRPTKIVLDGKDISQDIRKKVVTNQVSQVSAMKDVRKKMVKMQKEIVNNGNFVVEGRDIGTVVFPNADYKFFLSASLESRIDRRYVEMKSKNHKINKDEIKNNLIKRDKNDIERKNSPLLKADDAIEIDTTNISINEQVLIIYNKIKQGISE